MVKDKEGRLTTKDDDTRKMQRDHFAEVLNRPASTEEAITVQYTPTIEEIETGYVTKEIRKAVRNMRNGKAAGLDPITIKMLKTEKDMTTNALQ